MSCFSLAGLDSGMLKKFIAFDVMWEVINWNSYGLQVKKQGKQANIVQFRVQLDALGLKIVQVTADGNCFFRSVFGLPFVAYCIFYNDILVGYIVGTYFEISICFTE